MVLVLLSAAIKRVDVSRMRDFSIMFDAFLQEYLFKFHKIIFFLIKIALGLPVVMHNPINILFQKK